MRKVLASVGIGNATVDTVLPSEQVTPGETVAAEVRVEGGDAEQEVDRVEFELETRYRTDEGYHDATVDRFALDGFTIEPDAEEVRDVDIEIPYGTPVTVGNVEVWVETDLEVPMAVDPSDTDYLDVRPTARMDALFDAMDALGFSLNTAECEADPHSRYVGGRRFVQEFEFRPRHGPYRGDLDEVELVADPGPEALTVYVEVDRRGGLLSEAAGTDESRTRLRLESADADEAERRVREALDDHA